MGGGAELSSPRRPLSPRHVRRATLEHLLPLQALKRLQLCEPFLRTEARLLAFAREEIRIPGGLPRHHRRVPGRLAVEPIKEREQASASKPVPRIVEVCLTPVEHPVAVRAQRCRIILEEGMCVAQGIDGIEAQAAHKRRLARILPQSPGEQVIERF